MKREQKIEHSWDVKVEIGEGIVVGPEDRLVVLLKDADMWEEGALESFNAELQLVLGTRFIIIAGDVELAKVEGA